MTTCCWEPLYGWHPVELDHAYLSLYWNGARYWYQETVWFSAA